MPNEFESEADKLLQELNGESGETTTEEPVEDKPPVVEESEEVEKPLPFNKDPKVQKYIDKQVAKALEQYVPTETERFTEEVKATVGTDDDLVGAFASIIGNDTPEKVRVLKNLEKTLKTIEEKGQKGEEALEQLRQFQQIQEEENQAIQELSDGFERVKDRFKVDLDSPKSVNVRNEFIDFIKAVSHKDENGEIDEYPDIEGTFEIFQNLKKVPNAQTSRSKELASRSMQRSGEAINQQKRAYNWRDIDKLFSQLDK